jgi:hypothetical protein
MVAQLNWPSAPLGIPITAQIACRVMIILNVVIKISVRSENLMEIFPVKK